MRFVFIGQKGTGKSTIGKGIAELLKIDFYDIDTVIETNYFNKTNKKLTFREIFKEVGDKEFRNLELDAVKNISDYDFCVISTGGSSFLNPEIRKLLRNNSIIILIETQFESLWQRIESNGLPAYLLNENDPKKVFFEKYNFIKEVITPFADITIDNTNLLPHETINLLFEQIQNELMLRMFSPSTFGEIIRVTTFGESHGKALGAVLDGLPAGIYIDEKYIQEQLDKRKPGQSSVTTSRNESDKVKILSGIYENKTTGCPIAMIIENKDQDSSKYDNLKDVFRPGHADITFFKKFGLRDHRGGGRSSGRETVARVASGSIAKNILEQKGIKIIAYSYEINGIKINRIDYNEIDKNSVRCPDKQAALEMENAIINAKNNLDSVGGIVQLEIKNMPAGIGDPVFFKLDARLGMALFSIGSVKGVEFGDGFLMARMHGSEANDQINKNGFITNKAGGILGGISTGEDILIKIAVKPTPSISKEQQTIDINNNEKKIVITGRHDPCIVPRIIPVIESMAALVILDAIYLQEKLKSK